MFQHKIISIFFLLLVIALIVFGYYWILVFVLIIWLGLISWGAFDIRLGYFIPTINSVKTKNNKIAITFDDGPTEFTPEFLDLLSKYDAKATFFCIGKQIEKHPEILDRIYKEGHQIGNHSYSHHKSFGFFSSKKVKKEIQKTDTLIEQITTKKNQYFRPPFGVTNPHIAKAIKQTKHKVIGWNIRSLDTVIEDENKILERITKKLQSGSIILLHDTSDKSLRVLEQLLLTLQQKNFQSVTVEKLVEND